MRKKISAAVYRGIKWLVRLFYPKITVEGAQNLPDEPVIVVGNHTQMNGPICCELYFPTDRYTWCAGEMMHLREVPAYAYQDFWSYKPGFIRPFYKLLSYVIAPLCVCVFNNARTIGAYHDSRALSTFKQTVRRLQEGVNVVVFPERDVPRNHIVYDFQDKFIDVAKLYYKRTQKELAFVPLYIAPSLKKMYLGKPIRFCAENPMEQERRRICDYLMESITQMASDLPEHRVVPYRNVSKKDYPSNICKEDAHEKTCG